jgi:probable rRNA maturation factor
MRHTPRRVCCGSNHFSSDKQPKTRADGYPTKSAPGYRPVYSWRGEGPCAGSKAQKNLITGEYIIINKQRKHAIDCRSVRRFLLTLVSELGVQHRTVSVVLITDSAMQRYNRQYRGFDKPTDVLSFPGEQLYLGDILISSETAYNQSLKSRVLSFEQNVRRLILHGLLHLIGYDHETDDGQMRSIERRLRRRFQC